MTFEYKTGRSEKAERRPITEFSAIFEIVGFSRGCSSAKLCLRDVRDKPDKYGYVYKWEVFLTDAIKVIEKADGLTVVGQWTFVKRGQNWGIKLVE